jgi:hypothetical protein
MSSKTPTRGDLQQVLKIKFSPFHKHHILKAYVEGKIKLHVFVNSALDTAKISYTLMPVE